MLAQDYIPELCKTEHIPFEQKTIYQRYHFRRPIIDNGFFYDTRGFNGLIAELDRKEQIAFAYANLNDDQNAEWGLIYLPDLAKVGAVCDKRWAPVPFPEAKKLVYGFMQPLGSKEHHDWWLYQNKEQLMKEHRLINHKMIFREYEQRAYKVEHGLA